MVLASAVRRAALAVFANGVPLEGVVSAEVRANAYFSANRFSTVVATAASNLPAWDSLPLQLEIQIGLDGAWRSFATGQVDSLVFDPIRQEMTLHGRDLTALLIAAQTAETFENQTASDVAILLANRHGLVSNVAPTTRLVGRYFQNGRTRSSLSQHSNMTSEWDALTWMANQERFDVWIDGMTLYFQPIQSQPIAASIGPSDCTRMQLHRMLDLAVGPTVLVKSWDSQQSQLVTGTAQASATGQAGTTFTTLQPNLSVNDATQMAQRTLAELATHEIEVDLDMPGDLTTMPRMLVNLWQTGSDFDGSYTVMEIDRRISFEHGFKQSILAREMPWTAS